MKKPEKIEAFTLTELLVVLVISAIVVGLAFSVLDLVQKNFRIIRENYNHSTEVQHLKQQMVIDFNRYHDAEYNQILQELRMRNEVDSILYQFSYPYLIRNLDTLPVPVEKLTSFFLGNEISEGKIDAVKVLLGMPSGYFIFISKKNSAKTFFDHGHQD